MTLSPLEWLGLAGALVLSVGPGYGLLSFYPSRTRFDRTGRITIAIGLSIAAWAVALAWLHMLRIPLSPVSVLAILAAGWVIGLIRTRRDSSPIRRSVGDLNRVVLWVVVLIAALAGIWALRGVVAGPGSDAYHHTLITQLILDRGMLPDDYLPYAPLVTFNYHFGFHGIAAAVAAVAGLKPIVVVPILAQVLAAASALSVAFFAQAATGSRRAAAVSAFMAGLVAVFPAYYINWGRYTQLTGLVVLPIFLGLIWERVESGLDWPVVPYLGVLAGGMALAHYRVALMAASAVVALIGISGLMLHLKRPDWQHLVMRLIVAAVLAGVLIAPWVWHLAGTPQPGFPADVGRVGEAFFTLERLGPFVLGYPTNAVMLSLALMAVVIGLWRRERAVIALTLWSIVMLVLSTPCFAGVFMDTISVVISLYFPAAVAIGWLIDVIYRPLRSRAFRWTVAATMCVVAVWGALTIGSIVEPGASYVGPDDLAAMDWIRASTPVDARFMVNTFHWDFLPEFVIGSDAGYWLPLLAGRATVTAPMTYSSERLASPDFADHLSALDRLGGRLTSPEALDLLRREGITHVYVGERGGSIDVTELERSPYFKMLYHHNQAYVFEFVAGVENDGYQAQHACMAHRTCRQGPSQRLTPV